MSSIALLSFLFRSLEKRDLLCFFKSNGRGLFSDILICSINLEKVGLLSFADFRKSCGTNAFEFDRVRAFLESLLRGYLVVGSGCVGSFGNTFMHRCNFFRFSEQFNRPFVSFIL